MKKIMFYLSLLLCSCTRTFQIACYEPGVEVYINDECYGVPPVTISTSSDVQYVNVSIRRNGYELQNQRLYINPEENYYEISVDKRLQYSSSPSQNLHITSY